MTEEEWVQRILKRNERLKNERSTWEVLWNRALEFCAPQHGVGMRDTKPISGEKRGIKAFDGTPEWAKDVMVAGLYSGMTPDNYKYFRWMYFPLALNKDSHFRRWAEDCEDIAYQVLNASNYGDATYTAFEHQVVYGTAVKYSETDRRPRKLNFQNISLFDCTLAEDRHGIVDTVFREFKWSARNAEKEWGGKVPEEIKRAIDSGNPDDEFNFLHAVFPREDYDPAKADKKNMPWISLWIYPGRKLLLDEGGYREFPYSVPRMYKQRGEIYGRGPAIKALQTMGLLNEMAATNLAAGQRMVEPAIQYPADGFSSPIDLGPGGLNPYMGSGVKAEPINVGLNVPFGLEMEEREEKAVARYFHTDVFLAITNAENTMTATEALERKQEKLVLMGPAIGRQKREHLDADLDRIFSMLLESGQLPPPPRDLLNQMQRLDTEYVSPLFLAQRRRDSEAVMKVYQSAALIVQSTGRLNALDRLDDDAAIKLIAEREVVPSEILATDDVVQQIRQARQQQQQQTQVAQEGMAAVEAAKSLGQTPIDPGQPNALTGLLGLEQRQQ